MSGHPLIAVGFGAFFVVALVVGVRLLLLWRRTGELPELLIGLGVLGIGPVGFGCFVAAQELLVARPTLSTVLLGIGAAAVVVGVTGKLIFNWRVYRAQSSLVPWLVAGGAAIMVGTYALDFAEGFAHFREMNGRFVVRTPVQIGALLWGSAEALVYFSRMRRRVRLGLGDAVVCNRFLLWGVGAGAAGVGTLVGVIAQLATGTMTMQIPWVLASSSAHGFVAAVAMWLAFIPPGAYTRWIASRSAAQAA